MDAGAALRRACLPHRLRLYGLPGLCGAGAGRAARCLRLADAAGLLVPRDPLHGRRHRGDGRGALPLRLHDGADGLQTDAAHALRDRAGARPGPVPHRRTAAGEARHRRRPRAGADGDGLRLRHGRLLRAGDADSRNLQRLARYEQPAGGGADRLVGLPLRHRDAGVGALCRAAAGAMWTPAGACGASRGSVHRACRCGCLPRRLPAAGDGGVPHPCGRAAELHRQGLRAAGLRRRAHGHAQTRWSWRWPWPRW